MADVLVSPIFDFLLENLTSSFIEEVKLLWHIEDDVNNLSRTLSTIRADLEDAEKRQITTEAVKNWLQKLKDVAYDAADVLDVFATRAAQGKIDQQMPPESSSRSKKVRNFFTCCFLANELVNKHELGLKMNEICHSLDEIAKDQGRTVEKIDGPKTSSYVDGNVLGRDDDKKKNESNGLERLSSYDSWSLFKSIVFGDGNLGTQTTLKDIGVKIVDKCGGLPLAIKSLGGILSTTRTESFWKNVLESEIWELPAGSSNGTHPGLRLSYQHLPANLKQCFAYCALFPKNFNFNKDELVKLWMGEGYIQPKEGKEMEEVGEELFESLRARSFFSQLSNDDTMVYVMHNLIHNLAEVVSKDDCLRAEVGEPIETPNTYVRHLSFINLENIGPIKLDDLYKYTRLQRIRTFIQITPAWVDVLVQLRDSLHKFSCLRVLSLNGSEIKEIPDSIVNLKHLRYLDLSKNPIKKLPDSVCSLHNLQTLILKWCRDLIVLPKQTMDLINLRYLQLDGCHSLTCSPPKMRKLTQLRGLSMFIVGKDGSDGSECTIVELEHLDLRGNFEISSLENVANRKEAEKAGLKNKKKLEALTLKWGVDPETFDNSEKEKAGTRRPPASHQLEKANNRRLHGC